MWEPASTFPALFWFTLQSKTALWTCNCVRNQSEPILEHPLSQPFIQRLTSWAVFSTDQRAAQVQSSEESLNGALEDWGYTRSPHRASPRRGQSHQIIAASLGGAGARFLTLWGLWVSEITLERCCDGERAVVRQQHCSMLAVSNRQDDTQVI